MMLSLPESNIIEVAIDEAGRGCLAFEVCAAAVVLPSTLPDDSEMLKMLEIINDSKKVSEKKREKLAVFIKEYAIAYGIGVASPKEIDKHNILQATYMAMHRAVDEIIIKLKHIDRIIVDGDRFKPYSSDLIDNDDLYVPHTCVTEGDAKHMNIAAASILAKTHRDHLVLSYSKENPVYEQRYGFSKNKAYGTKQHMEGLKQFGITEFHRHSFAPVRKYA